MCDSSRKTKEATLLLDLDLFFEAKPLCSFSIALLISSSANL